MRVRETSYRDYGFDEGEEKRLKAYCRKKDFSDNKLLLDASEHANPDISDDLYYSIVANVSYDDLCKIKYIPLPKVDFYGYQRKCLRMFRNLLMFNRKWE